MRIISPASSGVRTPLASSSPRLTVGRDAATDWTLPDPARLLSRLHFEISNDADGVFVQDHSANGLVVNSSIEPVGKGNRVPLNTGDLLRFGPYVAEILIEEAASVSRDAGRNGHTKQVDFSEDRAARLAALAAFEADPADSTDRAAAMDSPSVATAAAADRFEVAASSQVVTEPAPYAVGEADSEAALSDFVRQTRVLIPADWNEARSPDAGLSQEADRSGAKINVDDARITALDALAKLACAVDPNSQGHPYARALHHYTATGRIAFHEIRDDFAVLNQKVWRLLSGHAPGAPIGGSDSARSIHEH